MSKTITQKDLLSQILSTLSKMLEVLEAINDNTKKRIIDNSIKPSPADIVRNFMGG